eukprot:724342-Rhodomonas_salina.2
MQVTSIHQSSFAFSVRSPVLTSGSAAPRRESLPCAQPESWGIKTCPIRVPISIRCVAMRCWRNARRGAALPVRGMLACPFTAKRPESARGLALIRTRSVPLRRA